MRLTKDIKTAILNAALKKAGIPDREAAIRNRYAEWAEAVRVRYVTPEAMALIEAAVSANNAVPALLRSRSFNANVEIGIRYANVAGMRRSVFFNGEINYPNDSGARVEMQKIVPRDHEVTIEADDPLTEQLYAIDHDDAALKSEREQLTVSLWAVLDSVTTDKRLVEVWPEAVAFIPAAERAGTSNLPALPIADLNKMIGLP